MALIFIRVELRGIPSREVYDNLHSYMKGWSWSQLDGSNRPLPHAMYQGHSDNHIGSIVKALRGDIQRTIWSDAIVFAVISGGWAMDPA